MQNMKQTLSSSRPVPPKHTWVICLLLASLLLSACKVSKNGVPRLVDTHTQRITILEKLFYPGQVDPSVEKNMGVSAQAGTAVRQFWLQEGTPTHLANFAAANLGCKWMGVAGQVFDLDGNPINSVIVNIGGTMNGVPVTNALGVTGTSDAYGPQGYEIVLGNTSVDTRHTLYIQLMNTNGDPISPPYYFDTYADCNKNLVVINFEEKWVTQTWFPLIANQGIVAGQ